MRMPRTSSFSVRDILDLGPKQGPEGGEDGGEETKLPVKTEPKPDLVKTGDCQASPRSGVVSSTTNNYFPGPAIRPPPHLAQWSNLSPFLSYNKCKSRLSQHFPLSSQIFPFSGFDQERG